ncbi:unnamed protein product [Prorocentrum cordatum]|uniref:PPPDE domain-containing protein n=1 Tax=Prorocentrum cordatum TaxID=2364126 RepID=A0ABN9RZG8_9DINO|nr:unnamed protein product [Polarella glacialis]
MYWLTSSNAIPPSAAHSWSAVGAGASSVEQELSQCFSSKLHHRLDFNPGTYSLLHHNCNKFSSEAMRYLDLPLFSSAEDKGRHPAISFSATREESWWRRHLYKATSALFGHERSVLSKKCQVPFFNNGTNCRRVSGGGRKGDCPMDMFGNSMRCYDPSQRASAGEEGVAPEVSYQGSANGVCGISIGERCYSYRAAAPCQPGAKCLGAVSVCQPSADAD